MKTDGSPSVEKYKSVELHPSPFQRIYGNERDCDVAFFASDNWRIPAHSDVLKRTNVVFRSMFSEDFFIQAKPGDGIPSIKVTDVDGRALDNLLRCLYGEPVPVQSIETALPTLYAGHKYRCPDLVNLCVSYLTLNLKDTNVLTILKFARLLAVDYHNLENVHTEEIQSDKSKRRTGTSTSFQTKSKSRLEQKPVTKSSFSNQNLKMNEKFIPSAPLLLINELDTIESSCSDLLQKCLKLIDKNAIKILESDELEEIDLDTLTLIFSRDTLNVQDEGKVFDALMRWAEQRCKQEQLPLTVGSRRAVLKNSIFLPRYLTMTLKAFQKGPMKSGIFAPTEIHIIQGLITGQLNLSEVNSNEAPLFLVSKLPRSIPPNLNFSKKKSKIINSRRRRGFSICFRFFRFQNSKCCQKNQNSQTSTPSSSYPGSPVGSNPSSPIHQNQNQNQNQDPEGNPPIVGRRESQTARMNFVEHMIVCFACLFD